MKNVFKPFGKKGVAIETAMFMMVVVFSLCTLLVMFAMLSRKHTINANNDFTDRSHIEQIGEDFCYYVRTSDMSSFFNYRYSDDFYAIIEHAPESDIYRLVVRRTGTFKHELTVEVKKIDTGIKVMRWSQFENTN